MEPDAGGSNNSQENITSFPGASFAQAINQLGLQDIPIQTSYPPLVPTTPSPSSSTASSPGGHGGLLPAAQQQQQIPTWLTQTLAVTTSPSAPTTASPTALPPPSSTALATPARPQVSPAAYYGAMAARINHRVASQWTPRPMTPEEIIEYRAMTHRCIHRLRILEAEQQRQLPNVDPRLEQAIFMGRVDFRARFPRIFRINDLPMEIFHNILHIVCWSAYDPPSSIRARVLLTSICQRWRNIAIADSTIWNAIMFSDYPDYEKSFTWFDRAADAPMDIRINDSKEKPWTLPLARQVIDKLFTKLSTIRALVVVLEDWDPLLYILDALQVVKYRNVKIIMERLEVHRTCPTYIQFGKAYEREHYERVIPLFGGAEVPSFKYLTANAVHIDWANSYLKDMEALDLRRVPLERVPTLEEFRQILIDSPNMRKLILDGAGPRWIPGPHTLPPIDLPVLRSLALGDFSSQYGTYAASQFSCLRVVDLTLMNVIREDFSPFWHLLTGRLPSLRALTLYGADLYSNTPEARTIFLKWLKSIPKLFFLRVNGVSAVIMDLFLFDSENMTSVANGRGHLLDGAIVTSRAMCPELKILEFHMMPPDYVVRWTAARRAMGVPLTKIYVIETVFKNMPQVDRDKLWGVMKTTTTIVQPLNAGARPFEELQLLV